MKEKLHHKMAIIRGVMLVLSIIGLICVYPSTKIFAQAPGDANGDGVINILDVTATLNDILGIALAPGNADCNNDGAVNILDVTCVLNIILQITPPPPASGCEDFINALCERTGECNEQSNFENCVSFFELFTDCNTIEVLPDANQCITDLDNFDCVTLTEDTLLPDTCTPVGTCNICESNADCPEGLVCSPCFDGLDDFPDLIDFPDLDGPPDCTGVVDRCSPLSFFFADCGDGFF